MGEQGDAEGGHQSQGRAAITRAIRASSPAVEMVRKYCSHRSPLHVPQLMGQPHEAQQQSHETPALPARSMPGRPPAYPISRARDMPALQARWNQTPSSAAGHGAGGQAPGQVHALPVPAEFVEPLHRAPHKGQRQQRQPGRVRPGAGRRRRAAGSPAPPPSPPGERRPPPPPGPARPGPNAGPGPVSDPRFVPYSLLLCGARGLTSAFRSRHWPPAGPGRRRWPPRPG